MATLQEKRKNFFMSEFHLHRYVEKGTAIATLVAANYFKDVNIGLEVGDLILITGSDATGLYSVEKNDRTGTQVKLVALKSA